jgi:hypothetical protein
MMPNSHDITALTHRVRDIFNEVWGQWSVACEMSALRIENAYYLLALITAPDESCVIFLTGKLFRNIQLRIRNKGRPISPDKRRPMTLVFVFLKHL